jgi:transposase
MKTVELYARVRHAVQIEGISRRAAAERFGINARTVSKMLKFSVPPGLYAPEAAVQAETRRVHWHH